MTELLVTVEGKGVVRDLAVDGLDPVGSLLPELAEALGLDPADRWRLVDGLRVLDPDRGLAAQTVLHGGVLRLLPATATGKATAAAAATARIV